MDCGCCYCSIICSGGYIYHSRASWPHKLIVSVKSEKGYHYTPRSDFHVSVGQLASLLVKVQSNKNEDDRYRMLLHAACAARLGRHFYNNLFIVMALYITTDGTVKRYFVFQPDSADRRVCTFESKQSVRFLTTFRFPMSRTNKTGWNHPSCLLLYSSFTTWYR
jgi:hypothetical protein